MQKSDGARFFLKMPLAPFFGQKGVKKGSKWVFDFFSKMALRIFLIFGVKLLLYKGFILGEAEFSGKLPFCPFFGSFGPISTGAGTKKKIIAFFCELDDSDSEKAKKKFAKFLLKIFSRLRNFSENFQNFQNFRSGL